MSSRIFPLSAALVFACVALVSCQNGPSSSQVPPLPEAGGFSPAEYTPGVKEAAEFAVRAQSKLERKAVKLARITQADMQIVAGRNYRLTLTVTQGKKMRTAQAVVYEKLDSSRELTSWTWTTP